MKRFLANKEFTKTIRHNKKNYLLKSIFDTNNSRFSFDETIAHYNKKEKRYNFDATILKYYQELLNIHDLLNDLYNTDEDLFN